MPEMLTVQRGNFTIDTRPEKLQIEVIARFLNQESYWAQERPFEVIQKSIQHSLNFGVYEGSRQVGYARVVTDYATFGWICDVFILPSHRGQGLSKWLVETIVSHPELAGIRRLLLATRDAHELYRRYGNFELLAAPERWMVRGSNPPTSQP